ncbi:hypothetical protein DDB_G0267750 [Dictyostelium discoideum AX4]|uniref:Uncharacterized protein n=1 Tax=Dictyostelium discoideum TaxID=44689 RepID=Q55GA2_DICDI|nr:hypothetical protein DDB_G0267750 [Dictyostelium discoideum AX4]EAL73328.1 hypothetical protein DDB_G0267750 [Dictyostelium discoideum AX4]|eukprot:XP_647282.1 hypothetical protein DDB_G0267750 [Dictyostelium discoideum AX4]
MEYFIGYEETFKEIEKFGKEYPKEKLLKFIREFSLNWVNQRDISNEQLKILKKSLNDLIENDKERTLLENRIIQMCPNYVIANFSVDEYPKIYLEFIKDYLTCNESLNLFGKVGNILVLLKKNLKNFNKKLSIEIINLLFELNHNLINKEKGKEKEISDDSNSNNNNNNNEEILIENEMGNSKLLDSISLLNCLLLFKEIIGKEGYQGEIKENILTLFNGLYELIIPTDDEVERFGISIPFENLIFLITLFQDYPNRAVYLNLLLKFVYFFECIQTTRYFQIKYQNELLEAINCEKVLFGKKESFPLVQSLVEQLLKHCKFDVFKLQGFLISINRNSYNEYFKYIFSIVEFDLILPIIQSSFPTINGKQIIKEILENKNFEFQLSNNNNSNNNNNNNLNNNNSNNNNNNTDNNNNNIFTNIIGIDEGEIHNIGIGVSGVGNSDFIKLVDRFDKSLESFFRIENYYKGANSKVEKKFLKKTYEEIFKQLNETKSINSSSYLESLFFKLDQFPIKFKFIKKRLNFILSQLDLYSINNILNNNNNVLKNEILENSIYIEKVRLENERKEKLPSFEIESLDMMPVEIIEYIVKFLIDSPEMDQCRKFQLSLLSKDFFRMVQSIMNRSIDNPIELKFNHFFHHGTNGDDDEFNLLQKKQVSYLKYWSRPHYIETDDFDSFLYRLNVVDSFRDWGHIISYTNQLKLVAFDFQGELDHIYLDYLKSNKTIQKLIIRTTSTNANQLSQQIIEMVNEKQQVDIHLHIDVKEEEPNINYRINFDLIQGCTVGIGQFFDEDFYKNCLPKIKELTILIEQWDPHNSSSFETVPIIDTFLKNIKSTTTTPTPSPTSFSLNLSNLTNLTFQFNTFDSGFDYFDKLIKLFIGNASNLKTITFENPGGGDRCSKPKKVIANILKSVSFQAQHFPSLSFIKIFKSSNITMFEDLNDEKDWYKINTFKFLPEPNFIIFNLIKNNNNNNSKRKFEEI